MDIFVSYISLTCDWTMEDIRGDILEEFEFQKEHLIALLEGDGHVKKEVIETFKKVETPEEFLGLFRSGVNLMYILNAARPNTINENEIVQVDNGHLLSCISKRNTSNTSLDPEEIKIIFKATVNLNKILTKAKSAGIVVVNVSSQDILCVNVRLILGLTWQIIRLGIFREVSLLYHPELIKLIKDKESLATFMNLSDEKLLIRWANYHLKLQNIKEEIVSLNKSSLSNGWIFLHIFKSVVPPEEVEAINLVDRYLSDPNYNANDRLKCYMDACKLINCKFVFTLKDLLSSDSRIYAPAIATLFNKYTGIYLPSDAQVKEWLYTINSLKHNIQTLESDKHSLESDLVSLNEDHELTKKKYSDILIEKNLSESQLNDTINKITSDLSTVNNELSNCKTQLHLDHTSVISSLKSTYESILSDYRDLCEKNINVDLVLKASKAKLSTNYNTCNNKHNSTPISEQRTPDSSDIDDDVCSSSIKNTSSESLLIYTHPVELSGLEPCHPPEDASFSDKFSFYISSISSTCSKINNLSANLQRDISSVISRLNKVQTINDIMSKKICEYTESRIKTSKSKKK